MDKSERLKQHRRLVRDRLNYPKGGHGSYAGVKWRISRQGDEFLCGYVILPDISKKNLKQLETFTHGGWTSIYTKEHEYGFDCAHPGDFIDYTNQKPGDTYKSYRYVLKTIHNIIDAYKTLC